MAAAKEASIRLGTTGKAEVKQTFAEIGDSGDAAAKRWSKSWERAAADADEALARQARAAEKLAAIMPKSAVQMQVEAAAGSSTRFGGGYAASGSDRLGQFEGSARASADTFRALFAEEERLEKQAIALRAAIDPVWGAQQRFNQEMGEARTLISAGRISLDEYVVKLRQEQAALDAVSGQHGKVGEKSNAMRTAMAGASYQVQDFITQISMGANPIQAFVVQGGQLAGQFQHVEGRAGALAQFFMGGWGLALQAALMVVPPLVSALWDAANANDEANEASKRHAEAVKALRDAVERLNGQQATRNHNTRQGIQDDLDAAEAARQHEIRVRGLLDAQLQQQRAELRASETASRTAIGGTVPGAAGFAADVRAGAARDQIAAIEGALKINDGKRADAERAIATGRRLLVMRQIAGETDKATAANQRYEDTIDRLNRQFEAGKISETTFRRLATDADAAKKKALELAEAGKKVVNEFGREVTSAQASAIARAAGLTVNSADRSVERQRQLYSAWVAAGKPSDNPVAKPGSSAHNRGNALDIQMSAGVTVAKIKSAFEAEGVRLTKIITERGHWHIEWARTAAQKQADKDMAKDVHDAAAAHRELQSDVDGLIKLLDPARAAGDAYAQTLLTIAKAEQAGMLTQGEAIGYRLTAAQQERDRRGKELMQASTAMFGGDDPLKELLDRGQREKEQQVELWNTNRERGMESYRSVADFYLNAMDGGTRSIWDLFRQNGLRVLSELLAKWTVGQSGGGGSLLKLLGLAGSASSAVDAGGIRAGANAALDTIPRNATGTEYFPGGLSVVGEFGKELVSLPRGSRVTPAAETRRMLAGNDNSSGGRAFHFDLRGAVVTQDLLEQMNAIGEISAARGAAGGSLMSQAEMRATSARRLGRRW